MIAPSSRRAARGVLAALALTAAGCGGGDQRTGAPTAATSSAGAGPSAAAASTAPATPAATATSSATASPTATASPSATAQPIAYCFSREEQQAGGVLLQRRDGTEVEGIRLGDGDRAVVLASQSGNNPCGWYDYATQLSGKGFSVLLFIYSVDKGDEDVVAAAKHLRDNGARSVALVGASKGGTMSVSAATKLAPPPDAVVSLSAPGSFEGVDAVAAAKQLDAPTLYVVAEDDGEFAADAQALHRATKSKDKTLDVVAGSDHGTALLLDPAIAAQVTEFVEQHA